MRRIELIMSDLFGYSMQTYFNWKKEIEKRPILELLEKYFTKEDLEEFIEFHSIQKFDDSQKFVDLYSKLEKEYIYRFDWLPNVLYFVYEYSINKHKINNILKADEIVLELFKEDKLNKADVHLFFRTDFSPLSTYINFNLENDWKYFYESNHIHSCYKSYHKLMLLIIQKDLYPKIVKIHTKGRIKSYIPKVSINDFVKDEIQLNKEYTLILDTIYEQILNNTFDYVLSPQVTYELNLLNMDLDLRNSFLDYYIKE